MSEQNLLSELTEKLANAEQKYMQLAGGKTACEIGKQGGETILMKEAEGVMQALRDLTFAIKRQPDDPQTAVQRVEQRWEKMSEISELWRVYKQAGLTEIHKFQ